MRRYRLQFILFIFLPLVSACAHYPVNTALKDIRGNGAYSLDRFGVSAESDRTFVILAFSGGGMRAAAFAYGVLEEMRKTRLPGTEKTLLDEVDVISTVSGGSFTGAYYALFGQRIFEDYKEKFLFRNIQGELVSSLFNPVTLVRLASPHFSRIDLAAELYDRTIFEGASFKSLAEKNTRPFLIINATNLYTGSRFEFTGDQFSYIGSDILSYPISRAVAASSAFPFLLSPVTLVNQPYPEGYTISDTDRTALKDYEHNKGRYYSALNNTLYADKENHPFLHLMDGGLADNIGLRAIQDLYVRGAIRKKMLNGDIERLVVIVVNAKAEPQETFDKKECPPGLATVSMKTATVSMDNYSFETVESIRKLFIDRIQAQMNVEGCQKKLDEHCRDGYTLPPLAGGSMKLYVADISFDNLKDETERAFLKHLPTSFSLEKDQVGRLIAAGSLLLREHPEFKLFIEEYR